MKKIQTPMQG